MAMRKLVSEIGPDLEAHLADDSFDDRTQAGLKIWAGIGRDLVWGAFREYRVPDALECL